MEDLKFRLKVRKMKCTACDTITLVEYKQPIEPCYVCPICCFEYMKYMDDIVINQEEH